jgi:hypothetical protein
MKPAPLLLLLPALAGPALGQVPVWSAAGAAPGQQLGAALVALDDLDGDGVVDLLAGAPRASYAGGSSGSVLALSGASGATLYRLDGAAPSELFGSALARVGDVDGDGIADFVVGAPYASQGATRNGRAEVRSGSDGSLLRTHWGLEAFGFLGAAVAGTEDLDGDGVEDYLVAAPQVDSNGQDAGQVEVRSGATGFLVRLHDGGAAGDRLGSGLASLGDVDGDGRGDYALGAPGASSGWGAVEARSGQAGALLRTYASNASGGHVGTALAGVADRSGDGRPELAIGAPESSIGGANAGGVIVLDVLTGSFPQFVLGVAGEGLGASLAEIGDWDGDGLADLAVGLGAPGGGVRLFSGAGTGNGLLGLVPAEPTSSTLGAALCGGIDIDGNGRVELLVGDPGDGTGGSSAGLVRSLSEHSLLGQGFCHGDGTAGSCPCGNLAGPGEGCANSGGAGAVLEGQGTGSVAQDSLQLSATGLLPGKAALAFAGGSLANGTTGVILGDGLRCAGAPVERLGVRLPDAQGSAAWGPGLVTQQGWSAGQTWRFQVWYRDIAASPCGSGFNLSGAYEVQLVP